MVAHLEKEKERDIILWTLNNGNLVGQGVSKEHMEKCVLKINEESSSFDQKCKEYKELRIDCRKNKRNSKMDTIRN